MAVSNKILPPLVLEFTLTTSPTGAFSLKAPNEKPINKGHLDLTCSQIRIYNFNTRKNVYIVTENGESRQVHDKEKENVQDMVGTLVRGLNLAETRLVGKVMGSDHVLAMQKSPLARLEKVFGVWSDCLGGQRGAPGC
jgi:hypothetical protein